ncbi:MAG: TRAP transporter small permease [bacterium]
MLRLIDAVLNLITILFKVLTQLLLVTMVAVIMWLVITRQVLHRASSWAEEISLVMIIWFGLIGATFGVRERYHLRMELFMKWMPRRPRRIIAWVVDALIAVAGVLLIVGGIPHILLTMDQTLPATKLPGALRYIPLPVTGALIVLYGVRNMLGGGSAADADSIDSHISPSDTPHGGKS